MFTLNTMHNTIFTLLVFTYCNLFAQESQSLNKIKQIKEDVSEVKRNKIIKEYKDLINKYPDKKELQYNLGNINFLNGQLDSAIYNYNHAIENKDENRKAHALYNLGNAHFEKGDIEKSIHFYKNALKYLPNDSDIRYNYELNKIILEQQSSEQKQNS